jgi:hypothetical protein
VKNRSDVGPRFERMTPAPARIRAAVARLFPLWRAAGMLPGEMNTAIRRWLDTSFEFLHARSLWIAENGILQRLEIPSGRVEGSWPFPDLAAQFRAGGVPASRRAFDFNERSYSAPFAPAYALGGAKSLWFARGIDQDRRYVAVPVVFNPDAASPWTSLEPWNPPDRIRGNSPSALFSKRNGRLLLECRIDFSTMMNVDEFMSGTLVWELDLQRRLYRPAKGAVRGVSRDLLLSTLQQSRDSALSFAKDRSGRFANAILRDKMLPITIPLSEVKVPSRRPDSGSKRLRGTKYEYLLSTVLSGASGAGGTIVRDHVSVPGMRRIAIWAPPR